MKRSWNRRRRQRQDIDSFLHLLNFFLMSHPKPLLLINNQKTQIFKRNVFRQNPVRPDQDVHDSPLQVLHCLFDLGASAKATHQIYPNWKILHALHKIVVMLLRQNRSRDQIGHLFALLDRFKRCTDGNFRFAIAHVPANQAVHNFSTLHVTFRRLDRKLLILRFFKRK